MREIFISHSSRDKDIVDAFVNLLQTGGNISSEKIFCSSLEGMGIPVGENFVQFIKDKLSNSKVVVCIITQNYISSQFCMAELGATWMLSHNIVPIVVPPLTYNDVKGILTGTQIFSINQKADLNNFLTVLKDILSIDIYHARWETRRQQFLNEIEFVMKNTKSSSEYIPDFLIKTLGEGTKFSNNIKKDKESKFELGKIIYNEMELSDFSGESVYFGAGTTIYRAFSWLSLNKKIAPLNLKLLTGNLTILMDAMANKLDNCNIVGDKFCREYASFYFDDIKDCNECRPKVSIICISGMNFNGNNVQFRTCWEEQAETLNYITGNTEELVIIPFSANKLLTADGNTFYSLSELLDDCNTNKQKKYIFVINTNELQNDCIVLFNTKLNKFIKMLSPCEIIHRDFIILKCYSRR